MLTYPDSIIKHVIKQIKQKQEKKMIPFLKILFESWSFTFKGMDTLEQN